MSSGDMVVWICFYVFAFGGRRIVGYAGGVGLETYFFFFWWRSPVRNFSWGRIGRRVHGVRGDLLFTLVPVR